MTTIDEHIRELCARVVAGEGAEFQAALQELQRAIEARDSLTNGDNSGGNGG